MLTSFNGSPMIGIGNHAQFPHKGDNSIIRCMHAINSIATGYNMVLAARDTYGSIGLYPRVDQPCQGGEFRPYHDHNPGDKFAKPHGHIKDGGRAHDKKGKPLDLYHPFPSGEIVAFGINLWGQVDEDTLKFIFSNDSPWKDAFGDQRFVDRKKNSLVITTSDIDPNVWMQLLWTIKSQHLQSLKDWVAQGFTHREAALICTIAGGTSPNGGCIQQSRYDYSPITSFNIYRFLNQKPYHLLDKTYREGGHYLRSHGRGTIGAEACWQDRDEKQGLNLQQKINELPRDGTTGYQKPLKKEEVIKFFRDIIDVWNTPEKGHMIETAPDLIGDGGTVFVEEKAA